MTLGQIPEAGSGGREGEAARESRPGEIRTCRSPQGIADQTCRGEACAAGAQAGEARDQVSPVPGKISPVLAAAL